MIADMLTLNWQGPIGIGNWQDAEDQSSVSGPKIYFYVLTYDESVVVYVGRSENFQRRLREYLRGMMGLKYWVRDSSGECVYNPGKHSFFDTIDALPDYFPLIWKEISRWQFCYADCREDVLHQVEAKLISHLMDNFPYEGEKKYWCDNSRRERVATQGDFKITMNIRDVSDTSASRCLQDCFGCAFEFEI